MKIKVTQEQWANRKIIDPLTEMSTYYLLEGEPVIDVIEEWDKLPSLYKEEPKKDCCPPHNLIDYHFEGSWGGSVSPSNKKCTKCLLEVRF